MMIHRDSWHYRLVRRNNRYMPDRLWPYVWAVTCGVCATLFYVAATLLVAASTVWLFIALPVRLYLDGAPLPVVLSPWLTLASLFLIVSIIYLARALMCLVAGTWERRSRRIIREDKNKNLLANYLEAQRQKLCPKIDFID